jgi:DNA (cytosine-5)-methyltransferase 1
MRFDVVRQKKIISLFCGPGGMDQGFKDAGFTTRLAYDCSHPAVITHRANHPEAKAMIADLSTIKPDQIILDWKKRSKTPPVGVIAGAPCQSFSSINSNQIESDPRHELPEKFAKILKVLNQEFNLDFFVFENVPGLLTSKHIEKFNRFKRLFSRAGFRNFVAVLDAKYFNVPQSRSRVFIVGINKIKYPDLDFDFPEENADIKTTRDALGALPEPIFFQRGLDESQIPYHANHWCMVPKSRRFSDGSLKSGSTRGKSFRVLSWDQPSYTVAYGHMEVHIHPNCHRRLSILEAMLLQGFSEDYVLKGTLQQQTRLVSEAVPPALACAIAESLIAQLK